MFFKSARDQSGYWETVNATVSTIDWCESNYTVSQYVAEWQNCFSSLWIALGGLICLYWSIKYQHSRSLQVTSFLVVTVGIGSALFHGSLLYVTQMLDELPMLWAQSGLFFVFLEFAQAQSARKKAWHKQLPADSALKAHLAVEENDQHSYMMGFIPMVPFYYIAKAISGTILEPIFAYSSAATLITLVTLVSAAHYAFGFVLVFQLTFSAITIASITCTMIVPMQFSHVLSTDQSRLQPHHTATIKSYRNWCIYYIGSALCAFVCWIIDNSFCQTLLEAPVYVSFHALWHWLCYFSTYSAVLLAGYALQLSHGSTVDEYELQQRIKLAESAGSKLVIAEKDIPMLHSGVTEVNLVSDAFVTPFSPLIGLKNQFPDASPV